MSEVLALASVGELRGLPPLAQKLICHAQKPTRHDGKSTGDQRQLIPKLQKLGREARKLTWALWKKTLQQQKSTLHLRK